jgi:hypothetical protein
MDHKQTGLKGVTPEDGTAVPKHFGVIQDNTVLHAARAFSWFSK